MGYRKKILPLLFLSLISTTIYAADNYPNKAIKYIVPFPPGGPTDIAGRAISKALSEELKQTVIVENKSGASGSIGVSQLIKSKADGYTLAALGAPSLTAPFMLEESPYNLSTDVRSVGVAYVTPKVILINPKYTPNIKDFADYIDYIKNNEKTLNYTTSGIGSSAHLEIEIIKNKNKIELEHIPYQGSAPGLNALLSGDVSMMYTDLIASLPHIKSGQLTPLAVDTEQRLDELKEVKTLKEQKLDNAKAVSWAGIIVPKATPDPIVEKLTTSLKKILDNSELKEHLKKVGAYADYQTPDSMDKLIIKDSEIWSNAIKDFNIK